MNPELPALLTAADARVRLEFVGDDGALAIVTLNRPDAHNVLDPDTAHVLRTAIAEVAPRVAEEQVRAVLLRGTGRSFCAGGDIACFTGTADERANVLGSMIPPLNSALHTLATLTVPVVSALNGAVGGGGIGLAFCADIVIAAESMVLRGGYTGIGLTPDVGSSWFLARAIGGARAKRVFFCNEKISAAQCLAWGLVSELVPDAELDARALALAQSLASSATRAIGRTKALVDGAADRSLSEQMALEAGFMVDSGRDSESAEGVAAFLARRAPRF
ncbi:enoyl-CoA hydratase/carnithine racemase [Burkholderiales bacterium JOSHI_001]|nr:enoyl-CoA hydratase/carnithine racemase [Burkholderiales bacterium JOSHI_001]